MRDATHGPAALTLVLALALLAGCELTMSSAERIARAEHALARGDAGAAIVDLKNVLQKDAGNAHARLLLARAELAQGGMVAAAADFAKVESGQAEPGEYERLRVGLLMAEGRHADVAASLASARPGLPEAERKLLLARALMSLGEAARAQPLLEELVAAEPGNEIARAGLGTVLAATAGPPRGIDYLQRAATELPRSAAIRRALGDLLLRAGDMPQAEAAYREAIALVNPKSDLPSYLAAAGGLGEALLVQNKVDAAAALVGDLGRVAPNGFLTYLLRGRVAEAHHDHAAALENLQKILAADPDNALVRMLVGAVNLEQGSLEQATANLQRVLATHPDFEPARRLLVRVYLRQDRPEDAASLLDERADADRSADTLLLRAQVALAAHDEGKLAAILEQLDTDRGVTEKTRLDVAALYLEAGHPERALNVLKVSAGTPSARADQLGLIALVGKDRAAGVRALQEYGRRAGQEPAGIRFAALALSALGEFAPALGLLGDYVKTQPRDVEMLGSLAQVEARAGRLDDAEATLRRSLEVKPTVETRIALSQLAAARGRLEDSIRWLEQARVADSKAAAPRALLVRAYLAQHKEDAAQKAVDELLAIDTTSAEPRLLALGVALARKDEATALRMANEAVKVAPGSPAAWLLKGRLHARLKQVDEARTALRRAVALAPRAPEPLNELARLELASGNPAAALAVARAAEGQSASRVGGVALEGDLLMQQGRAADAVRAYERLQSLQPSTPGVLALYRARLQAGLAAPEATLTDWLKAHPRDVAARATLAGHWDAKGERARARAEYETALQLEPNSPVLLNNIALLYAATGDNRALPTARRAYALAPLNPAIADTLGWMLVEARQLDEGLARLREAGAAAPESPDIQYHLASALARSGDKAGMRAVAARFAAAGTPPQWRDKFAALAAQ